MVVLTIILGTTVPTMNVGTPNLGFLLAVPTNLSEQTTIFNSASRLTFWINYGRDSIMEQLPVRHINKASSRYDICVILELSRCIFIVPCDKYYQSTLQS